MRVSAKIVLGCFVQKYFCSFLPSSAKARASGSGLCLRVSCYGEEDLVGRIKRTVGVHDSFGCANPKTLNLPNAQFPRLHPRLAVSENPRHLGRAVLERWAWQASIHWRNKLSEAADSDA